MIGQLIVSWRKQNRYGVREAAKLIGVSSATLSRIENGGAMDQRSMLKLLNWLFAEAPLEHDLPAETEATDGMIEAAIEAYEAREWNEKAAVPFAEENREDMRAAINAAIRVQRSAR